MKNGDKYNRLTAIKFVSVNKWRSAKWLFKCDCGNEKEIRVSNVKNGHIKSCGCYKLEFNISQKKTHGMSFTNEYSIWKGMKSRCNNKKNKSYKNYGGRGIKVCDRWCNFETFLDDMGYRPKGLTLDRIDNNGDYTPENCIWATNEEQANNTRNTTFLNHNNKRLPLSSWAIKCGIKKDTLRSRLRSGWSIEKTLETPLTHQNLKTSNKKIWQKKVTHQEHTRLN